MSKLYLQLSLWFGIGFLIPSLSLADPNLWEYRRVVKVNKLKNCPAVQGVNANEIFVKNWGDIVALPPEFNRAPYTITLSPKPKYYACGLDKGTGLYALYGRRSILFSKTQKLFLKDSDFPPLQGTPNPGQTPNPQPTSSTAPTPVNSQPGCGSVRAWPGSFIYKTMGSSHFSPSDPRRTSIGLVMKRGAGVPIPQCIDVLAVNATPIAQMGFYERGHGWHARYYGGIGCGTKIGGAALGQLATSTAGSNEVYVRIENVCYGPIDATHCTGSSQCN